MMKLERLISRDWWKTTVLVLIAVVVMIRLGIWQLDRLAQRRAFNARVEEQLAAPPLPLDPQNLDLDLFNMEYRSANVSGEFDLDRQIVLRNQDWQGQLGVHILTPLMIEAGGKAILVDRGWVPYEDYSKGNLSQYDVEGSVEIEGILRRSQSKPLIGGRADQVPGAGEQPLEAWYWINIQDISGQMPYELLPVYLVKFPDGINDVLPTSRYEEPELTEGSHLGYAFQWFIFAAILGIGYPIYVSREDNRSGGISSVNTGYFQTDQVEGSENNSESKGFEQA